MTLEARPRGGPLGLPYIPKNLEKLNLAVQRLNLIHPHELEISCIQDFTTPKENATTKDLPFFKEKTKVGDDAIATEKPGPEDSDTAEMDDAEKAKEAEDTTPEKATEVASKKATTEVASNATPRKDSTKMDIPEVSSEKTKMAAQQDSTEITEMAVQEDSPEMTADSSPEE